MPTGRHLQTTFSAGEFDPLLYSREDVAFFYNSARIIENGIPLPQGGVKRREGWAFSSLMRGTFSPITILAADIVAAFGGTIANLLDQNTATEFVTTTTVAAAAAGDYPFIRWNAPAPVDPVAIDLVGVYLKSGDRGETVQVQRSPDGVTWTTVGSFPIDKTVRTYRVAAPTGQSLGSAAFWRVNVVEDLASDGGFVAVQDMQFHTESGWHNGALSVGNFNLFRLTADIDNEYALVLTAGNCDVYRFSDGAYVASVRIPHTDGQVGQITSSASLDSIILYHVDQPPFFMQRVDGDTRWCSRAVVFDTIARLKFDTPPNTGGLNEKQILNFQSMSAGNRLVFEFNGETSAEITWSATQATNVTNFENALNGMASFAGVDVTAYGSHYQVEWTGVDGKRPWAILVVNILEGSGTCTIDRLQYGREDTDDLWSATRGYPSCGCFYQGRHWMGGFRSRPDVIAGSRAGAYFDFKADADPVAGSPILVAPNVDDQVSIQALFPGRHLQIFTSSTEFYVPDEPITIDNIALKATSRFGANQYVRAVDVQGGTLFVDRNGRAIREYLYTDTEQSYSAEPISIMAGHLVAEPRFLCLRRALDVDFPTLLMMANYGTDRFGQRVPASFCVIDRAQQVTGFVRITTPGTPLGFITSQGGKSFAVTERSLAGPTWKYLEIFDADHMSDAAVFVDNPDVEDFTALAAQTVFTYTFTSPVSAAEISVWSFDGLKWLRVSNEDYAINLGAKTVTFTTGRAAGDEIRIAKRVSQISLTDYPFLEGVEVYVHGDGMPIGLFTSSAGVIDLGDQRFDFQAEIGLRMVPRIVMQPYKGKGEMSPTMRNMRIFEALIQVERTGALSIGQSGRRIRPVPLQRFDSGLMDPVLEEVLYTGAKRIAGLGDWSIEPCLEISQDEPMPFLVRSVTYDVRF